MKECLVIVDVQKGFLNNSTMFIPQKIKELCDKRKFDIIVSTKFINNELTPHYQYTNWKGMLDKGSQELDPYIKKISERIFDKSVNTVFTEEFIKFIEDNKIEKMIFVGIDTDCCVMKSAFDCFDKKIPFEVITECCASSGGDKYHKASCMIMKRSLGTDFVH